MVALGVSKVGGMLSCPVQVVVVGLEQGLQPLLGLLLSALGSVSGPGCGFSGLISLCSTAGTSSEARAAAGPVSSL